MAAQRASSLVKIIGINGGAPQAQGIKAPDVPKLDDVTDQKFAEAQANIQKMYQSTLEGLQSVSAAKQAQYKSQGRSAVGSELQALGETVLEGVKLYKDNEAKKKAAQDKAEYEQRAMVTKKAVQEQLLQLESRIQSTSEEEGINTTYQEVRRIMAENEANLTPDDAAAINTLITSNIDQARERQTTRLWNAQEQVETQRRAQAVARTNVAAAPLLVAISKSRDPARVQQGINEVLALVGAQSDLSEDEKQAVLTDLYKGMASSVMASEEARQVATQTLTDLSGVQGQLEEGRSKYGRDPVMWQAYLTQLATNYPSLKEYILSQPDALGLLNSENNYNEANEKLKQYAQRTQDQTIHEQQATFEAAAINTTAFNLLQPGAGAARLQAIKAQGANASAIDRAAVAQVEAVQQAQKAYQAAQAEQLSLNQQLEALTLKADPTQLGNDDIRVVTDPQTGVPTTVIRVPNGALAIRPGASQAEVQAMVQRINNQYAVTSQLQTQWAASGFDLQNLTNPTYQQKLQQQLQAGQAAAAIGDTTGGAASNFTAPAGSLPNFREADSQGRIPGQPIVPLSRLIDGRNGDAELGVVSPISGVNAVVTDGYGDHGNGQNMYHDGRFHSGIDIGSDERGDIPVRAVSGGVVLHADDWSGFGGTVTIRTPDGYVEQYSHMRAWNVKPGDEIPPGTALGLMGGGAGDPHAGGSSGRHIHFTVYNKGTPDSEIGYNLGATTVDPLPYLSTRQYGGTPNTGSNQGAPPSQFQAVHHDAPINPYVLPPVGTYTMPNGFVHDFNASYGHGEFVTNGIGVGGSGVGATTRAVPFNNVATPATPVQNGYAPLRRDAYTQRGDPTANYGYQALRDNTSLRRGIAAAANALNVPGQWIADILYAESSFDKDIMGGDGGQYAGLIQISPDNLRALGRTHAEIQTHDHEWYMRNIAVPYWQMVAREAGKQYETIEDLYAAIQGGSPGLGDPPEARTWCDSNACFPEHMAAMGHAVGRRYRTTWTRVSDASSPTMTVQAGQQPPAHGSWTR